MARPLNAITTALCGAAMLANTAFASDGLWPDPVAVPSSFETVPRDIKGIAMTMTLPEIQKATGGKMAKSTWRFTDFDRLSKEKISRRDMTRLDVSLTNTRDMRDELEIMGSQWHTGNKAIRMIRRVTINDAAQQPLTSVFVSSVLEKYGPTAPEKYQTRGYRGLSNAPLRGLLWTFDNGHATPECELYELPNPLEDVYKIKRGTLEGFLADMEAEGVCDGFMHVLYSTTTTDTVSQYAVEILDIRLLIADALNNRRVQEHMQSFLEDSVTTGNTNTPDL